ncbi:hypothetical protein GCM10010365_42350 [Streptomyces poonensis]|uniref:Uncharacterized protein n=1 Tax=Streptomyces poonensis TaxID=68255 RepID=A0A918PQN1_9ACTN|nr:hypothetical protein GCM10010365_42350 [Streptomyces poonensis]GLJ91016.1 hypothetical protein GCM10017589_36220 [Streptomyces poonensis]
MTGTCGFLARGRRWGRASLLGVDDDEARPCPGGAALRNERGDQLVTTGTEPIARTGGSEATSERGSTHRRAHVMSAGGHAAQGPSGASLEPGGRTRRGHGGGPAPHGAADGAEDGATDGPGSDA